MDIEKGNEFDFLKEEFGEFSAGGVKAWLMHET